jgi:hypothetical protein
MMANGRRTLRARTPSTYVPALDFEFEFNPCGYGPEIRCDDTA